MTLHTRLRPALLVLASVALITGAVFGQDDDETDLPDTGTPGLTSALDNLDLPPVPPAPSSTSDETPTPSSTADNSAVPSPGNDNTASVCTCNPISPTNALNRSGTTTSNTVNTQMSNIVPRLARFGRSGFNVSGSTPDIVVMPGMADERFAFSKFQSQAFQTKHRSFALQSAQLFEHAGFIITLTEDYRVEVIADDGTVWFSGQAGTVGADRLVIQGTDDLGYYYAIADGYFMANTPDGDVWIDNGTTTYMYDFDEKGTFVGLSDSDGNSYTVEFEETGTIAITDMDGITSSFAEDGSFEMVDENGSVLERSSLYGDDDAAVHDADDEGEASSGNPGGVDTTQPDDSGSEAEGGSEDGGE